MINKSQAIHLSKLNAQLKPILIDYGDKIIEAEDRYYNSLKKRADNKHNLNSISPVSVFRAATARICGTGMDGFFEFRNQVKIYRRTLIDYLWGKNAFGSIRYICLAPLEYLTDERSLYIQKANYLNDGDRWKEEFQPIKDVPRWRYIQPTFADRMITIKKESAALVFMLLAAFVGVIAAMRWVDVR